MKILLLSLLGMYLFFGICITHAGYSYRKETGTMKRKDIVSMIIWPVLYLPLSIYRGIYKHVKESYVDDEESKELEKRDAKRQYKEESQ